MKQSELHIPIEFSNQLKLFACVIIMMHHYCQYGLDSHKISGSIYEILRSVGGDLSVTLFFFLSGYGLMVSENRKKFELKRFFVKRFWRVLEPFWIVNFIAVIIYWILGVNNIATESYGSAIASILGIIKYDPTMWFVHFLLALYILFAIGMILNKPILFVSWSVIVFIILSIINHLPSHLWSSLFAFPLGMIVGSKPDKVIRIFRRFEVLFTCLFLYIILLYTLVFRGSGVNGNLWHQMNNVMLIVITLFIIGRIPYKYLTINKLPARWQPYYEIYLVHPKILFITIFSFGLFLPIYIFIPLCILLALIISNLSSLFTH